MKLGIHFTALGSTVDATLAEARRKADVAADGRLYDLEITDITEKALYGDGRTALKVTVNRYVNDVRRDGPEMIEPLLLTATAPVEETLGI